MNKIWAFALVLTAIGCTSTVLAADANRLTLSDALALALANSPTISSAEAAYGAASGERMQAALLPNPSFGLEAENLAGTGAYNGIDNAELTLGINQLVQIGGKRPARIRAAGYGKTAAQYGQEIAKLDLVRDVKVSFAEAVAAQEQSIIMQQQEQLARDVFKTVDKRVSAAAEPIVQRNKARIALANAELIAQRAKGQKEARLKILAALWNNVRMPVAVETKAFYAIEQFVMDGNVENTLQNTADYQRQSAEISQAHSLYDLERANAIPDPTFSVGVRELRATNDQALVAGLSIPLPVFNRNQGTIESARQQAIKAEAGRRKTLLTGQADLAQAIQSLQNASLAAERIKTDILPEAQEAFAQAKRGYNAGKFAYLEVLDAQRTLTDTRIAYIQALRDYHVNRAEAERLTAQAAPQEKRP